ncbi:MAG TPA: tail fiber domain-containing protein [Bacteroidales bacterium]|nr:tail fiber domain-containing protein [Bacteroidales bacterium]
MKILYNLRKLILTSFIAGFLSIAAYTQSSVGINTTNPNPNAVLELVSPNNNQGLKIPSLTTAQRTNAAFVNNLTAADKGLIVFDSDIASFFYWSGSDWTKISKGEIPTLEEILAVSNSAASKKISDLANPENAQDAATKKYIDDSLTVVNQKISIINDSITNFDTKITNLKTDVTNLDNRVTNTEGAISSLQTNITNLDNRLTTTENNVTTLQTNVSNLQTNVSNLQTNVTNLDNRVTTTENNISTLQTNVSNLQTDVTNLQTDVTNIDNRLTTTENNVTTLQTDVTNLDNRVTTTENSISNLQTDVTNLENNVTTLQTDITNLISNPELTLAEDKIFVGNASGKTNAVDMTGAITINSTGATTLTNGIVTAPKLAGDNIGTPLTNGTVDWVLTSKGDGSFKWTNPSTTPVDPNNITLLNGNIFVGNASDKAAGVTMQGDATIINNGTITIANNAITSAKIANGTIANIDLDKANIPLSGFGAATTDVSLGSNKLINVADPTLAQDAATKNYVDTKATSDLAGKANVNQTFYLGTTNIAINRASGSQSLTGITSIDGSAATLTTARLINGTSFNGSANITVPLNTTTDNANAATMYPVWTTGTGNNQASISTTKLSFVPSTGILTATGFSGSGAGLTNIPNAALSNSSITIGTTAINLGASSTTLAGLTSVTSTSFTGALTGNATTATTATNIAGGVGGSIPYQTAANTTALLANGTVGQVLTSAGGTNPPTWSSISVPTGANPTASIGLTATNGVATTFMRSDAAPALDVAITPTWTGAHIWSALGTFNAGLNASGAAVNLNANSNNAVNIGTGTSTGTVTIGGTAAQTIAIGNGAAAKTVTLGSTNTTSTTTINAGTGNILLSAPSTTVQTNTATDDQIRILPYTGGAARFAGTVTSADLTAARTWTLPDATGTLALTTDIPTVPTAANPTASIGLTAINGSATTFMRSDAAPALDVAITPTWTGAHIWSALGTFNAGLNASGAAVNLNANSNNAVNIGTGTSTGTVTIGGTAAQTIAIGNGAAAKTVTLGSTNTTSTTTINAGTGGINLTTGAATSMITTLGTTGAAEFRSSTANSDRIRILPQSTAVGGTFTGTLTSADLTAARTWTLPDADGTFLMGSGLTTNTVPRWNGSALGNSSIWDNGSGNVHIGNSTISASYALQVTGAFKTEKIYHSSDARWKQNVLPIDNALSKVQQLRGVTYEWKTEEFPEKHFSKGTQIGLIAQEVEKVLPELVITDDTGYKAVEYANIVAVLIEAIKEQQAIIDAQKLEIEKLQVSNESMKQEITQLQTMQTSIESMQKQINSMQALLQILQPTAVQTQK